MSHRLSHLLASGFLLAVLILAGCGSGGGTADGGTGSPEPAKDAGKPVAEKPKANFYDVVMSDNETTEAPKETFTKETPKIFAFYRANGLVAGDKLKGVWICEKSDVAPPNYKIDEISLDVDPKDNDGNFSLSKPTNGWPVGSYRVEMYINDRLDHTAKFAVK